MKKVFNKLSCLIPAYILAFALSFMLFIYEPILLYATNIDDFWFDFYIMIIPVLLLFFTSFIGISGIFTALYFINKRFLKKINIYNICLISFFVIFMFLYIQGNYLIRELPALDGSSINWDSYNTQNIISLIVFIVLIVLNVILIIKLKLNRYMKVIKFVPLAIVFMLLTSLISILPNSNIFEYKNSLAVLTNKNFNIASKDKNLFVLVVDSVDSVDFQNVLNDSEEYKDTFNDFTYYPDTLGAYPFTRNSIPFMLSGVWYDNKTDFNEFSNKSISNSKLIKSLVKEDYDVNIYSTELTFKYKDNKNISNSLPMKKKAKTVKFIKQELKYILFKYLPYNLKKYSKIRQMSFNYARPVTENVFNYENPALYNQFTNVPIKKVDNKVFSFIHAEGGHVPFNQDEDFNFIENGTYTQKLRVTLKLIDSYLNRLKEYDVYDNSAIVIISDHGYNYEDFRGRQNPILFIKGIDEQHSMEISEKQISFDDLQDVYSDLLNGKTSKDLFNDIDSERERKYMFYDYGKTNHMYEYIQEGKAWEEDTLIASGKEYILK